MKLSERIHLWIDPHRVPDIQDAFDLQEMVTEVAQLEEENGAWKKLMRDLLNDDEQPVVGDFYFRALRLLAGERRWWHETLGR